MTCPRRISVAFMYGIDSQRSKWRGPAPEWPTPARREDKRGGTESRGRGPAGPGAISVLGHLLHPGCAGRCPTAEEPSTADERSMEQRISLIALGVADL